MFVTHGMSRSSEYRSWTHMRWRCDQRNVEEFPNYAGRGIRVCKRWQNSFENFLADMGRKPFIGAQIDRINNNGHYTPRNCRWANKSEQALNRRPPPSEWCCGEKNPAAKISRQRVDEIRALRKSSQMSYARLAKVVGLSNSQVFRICKGASWK